MKHNTDLSIIGGCGHIGLPLGLAFANKGLNVTLIDNNRNNVKLINKGICPYKEDNADTDLKKNLKKKKIFATSKSFFQLIKDLKKFINKNQILIIRSSVYPGLCEKIIKILNFKNICYCPERVVQGKMLVEIKNLTQIVSGYNQSSISTVAKLFKKICKKIIITSVFEAELIKLFSNAYRYIHFAIANEFYMICKKYSVNFNKLRKNMIDGYSRNSSLPSQGLTAGPCLLKDTMQLFSFTKNTFDLGLTSMKINERLPIFLINNIEKKISLKNKTVGILGLAFKAETDDIRDSLSIKLLKYLKKRKINTLQSDPFYKNEKNIDAKSLIKKSDIVFIATPHNQYKKLNIPKKKIVIDVWNIL